MSILIKGMEMPTRCFSCPMCDVENAEVNCAISHGSYIEYREVDPKVAMQDRPEWCPLVEVPPHGRLIDLDGTALAQYYDEEHEEWSMETVTVEDILWGVCENMPPIVIPADNQGGDVK